VRFETEIAGGNVVFTTRRGGVSEGPYESLNLGILTGDERENVLANRRILAEDVELAPESIAMGRQVHGTDLQEWDAGAASYLDPDAAAAEVDGNVTRTPGVGVLVFVADCLPVALVGDGAVAMVHCGWRGLAGGIIAIASDAIGGARAAAVGPGIGPCCYEVGDDVLAEFAEYPHAIDGRMLDLRAVAVGQLRAAGVEEAEHVDLCTSCNPEMFFSHRRDEGVTGRQGGLAWLTA
jgi:YfiH family protein